MKDVKRPKGIFAEGAGGGGSGGSNDANTLFSTDAFEMVLGISEGPIYGLDGTTIAEQLSNLFVDDVPVMSKSGSLNFKDSDFVIRYESGLTLTDKDDPDYGQSPIQYILGGQATPHNVSAELLPQIEIIRNIPSSITGQFDRVEVRLLINQLYKITSKGYKTDFIPITIKWRYVGDTNWNTVFQGNISGKTTVGGFVKGYSFAVDDKTRDVEISVMNRDSAGIDEEEHVHKIAWLNYETEKLISEENQEYHPNTAMLHVVALIGNEIQRLPNISGVWKGLLCRVPSNYDPETRTYNEATPWDGSFKLQKAWTDNPFWIAYELITNTEFGLYKYNPRLKVNRYSVYALAKDADEMVEGTNGLTPRYTFNALITEPMLGLELINYIVGTAHARVVDGQNGEIEFLADRNTPSVATITPEICIANSEDVVFNYSFSDIKNRYNEVRTSYVDPDLNWEKQTIGPFIDTQAQSKFGANVDEYDSLGCIYPDEVKRKAYLRLISYQTETMSVSFMMPTNGPVLKVFDIVDIVDPDQNWGLSGRASSYTEDTLKLRDELYFDESGVYDLKIPLKGGGYFEGSIAVGSAGFHSELYLVNSASLPNNLATYTPFTIQKSDAEPGRGKPFRIISMKRDGENVNQVAITAIEVNRSKWDASDNFELVGSPRYNFELPPTPEQPRNVTVLKEEFVSVDNVTAINLWLSWDTPSQVFMGHYYEVSLIKNGVDLGVVVTTDNTIVEVPELSFGEYQIKVTMVYNGVRASSDLLPWELRYLSFTNGNYDPNRLELEIEANFLGADLFLEFGAWYTYNLDSSLSYSDIITNNEIDSVEIKIFNNFVDGQTDINGQTYFDLNGANLPSERLLKTISTKARQASFLEGEHLAANANKLTSSLLLDVRLKDLDGVLSPPLYVQLRADNIPVVTDIEIDVTYKSVSAIALFDELTTKEVQVEWYLLKVPEQGLSAVSFEDALLVSTSPKLKDYIHIDNGAVYCIWAKSISEFGETPLFPASSLPESLIIFNVPEFPYGDLTEHVSNIGLDKLSDEAQTLISDINQQVDRLRPETEDNLPSLIARNIDAITGLNEKVEVLDPENPNGLPSQISEIVEVVDIINADNPNNIQSQLEQSNSKITNLERVTEVLDESDSEALPALIKVNQVAIERQRLEQQDVGLSLLNVTSAYTNWRNEYERRTLDNENLIDAAVYVDPETGTIVNRAYAYTDESFNSAQILIEGAESKITLNAEQIASSQNRISKAEASIVLQAGQIKQRATHAEVDGQIAGALAALQPAYNWQFNTGSEGFTGIDSHNALGYIVATNQVVSPAISFDAGENPMFRLRVRKHVGATWKGNIKFNSGTSTLHLPEPTSDDWEILTLDATGTDSYTGTINSLEFDLGSCDIDFIEVGKRGANDLALADVTSRTTSIENDIDARTGRMSQYATTTWVNALGFQTQSNVETLIDSFNTKYSISAVLQEFDDNDTIVKANIAKNWVDGANATINNQVASILNSENGVNERISSAEQNLDAIKGEISQTVSQISGLELDVKEQGLADILQAYNQLQQDNDLAEQGYSLAVANEKLTAVTDEVQSLSTQQIELVSAFEQNQAYFTSLSKAFSNERSARSTSEQELRAEIIREGKRSVAQANERLEAIVGYCVDDQGNRVDEIDAVACQAAGNNWVDAPLVELINQYTTAYVTQQGFQTATNVEEYISTLDAEFKIIATVQQINDDGIITAAKNAQQWINASEGTINNLITQFVNSPDGINETLALAEEQIRANADDLETEVQARQQLSARMGEAEADLVSLDEAIINEQQARASLGTQIRLEFQTQDLAMLATANEYTRAVTGYCVDSEGNRVDEDDAVACEAAGHTWVDGPAVQRAVEISAAWVTLQGFQTQSNVQQSINSWNAEYKIIATVQQINDEGIITAAKNAQQWINASEGTINNLITQFVNSPDGINESIAYAEEQIRANADDLETEVQARQQLSARMGEAEADLVSLDEAIINEQQARASLGTQIRLEFQTQDLAMLATANEFTRAVTGYCIDAQGNRVDEDDAVACEAAGHTWVDGPAVQRAVEIGAAWVTLQGFQTQSNVQQLLNTFDATYKVSATLQQFSDNDTLQKANNAQQFINGAESYIAQRITAYNAQEGGVNAKFSDVNERLDAAEGSISTSIVQIQGLEQAQQASDLNDVINAYENLITGNQLAELDVKAAFANEQLQAQTNQVESLAQQQLELAALFNDSKAIITSLNQAVSSQYQSSVIRDQRYQATFENVSARFSDVTTAIATIDEANTIRDQEFESFVADTISQFDEVAETFASQNQAFSTLQQTLTAKINEDTEAARSAAVSTAQEYTRTAVGYCVNAEGQITSETDAVQCVTDGGNWISGPLAEYIENLQIRDGENSASIKQLRQLFTTVDGKLVARGGWTLDNNGRVVGIAGYNDGEVGNLDLVGDVIRQGVMVNGTFVPTSYIDNSDPDQPIHIFKGRLELGDGHTVNSLEDIRAQDGTNGIDGQDGKDGITPTFSTNPDGSYTISNGTEQITIRDGENAPIPTVTNNGNGTYTVTDGSGNSIIVRDGEDGENGKDGYTPVKGTDYFDGNDGSFVSYVFKAATSKPSTPSGGSFNGTSETFPSGWNDTPVYVSGQITWVSKTRYRIVNNAWTKTGWSSPVEYIIRGEKGADGQNGNDGQDGNDGLNGQDGADGTRGSIAVDVATSSGAWSDSVANANVPGSPVIHDRVTIYKSSDPAIQTTKRFNGSSWVSYTLQVHGSAIIDDTLDAKAIRAGSRMESPRIDLIGGAFMKIELASGFGPDNLWYWFGPKIMSGGLPNLAALTKSNAIEWKDTAGNAYFGGAITAGILSTALTTSDLSATANVTIGPFGSNGGVIDIVCSLMATSRGSGRSSSQVSAPSEPSYTIRLYELVSGSWVTRKTQSFTGESGVHNIYDGESNMYDWIGTQSCSGSFTYTDNKKNTTDRTYKLAITSRNALATSGSYKPTQKLTLVSQEG